MGASGAPLLNMLQLLSVSQQVLDPGRLLTSEQKEVRDITEETPQAVLPVSAQWLPNSRLCTTFFDLWLLKGPDFLWS